MGSRENRRDQFKWIPLSRETNYLSVRHATTGHICVCQQRMDGRPGWRAEQESQHRTAINTPSRQLGCRNWNWARGNSERSRRLHPAHTDPSFWNAGFPLLLQPPNTAERSPLQRGGKIPWAVFRDVLSPELWQSTGCESTLQGWGLVLLELVWPSHFCVFPAGWGSFLSWS